MKTYRNKNWIGATEVAQRNESQTTKPGISYDCRDRRTYQKGHCEENYRDGPRKGQNPQQQRKIDRVSRPNENENEENEEKTPISLDSPGA